MGRIAAEKAETKDMKHRETIVQISKILNEIIKNKLTTSLLDNLLEIDNKELVSYGKNIREYDGMDEYLNIDRYNLAINILEESSAATEVLQLFNTISQDNEDISTRLVKHTPKKINIEDLDLIQLYTAGKVREKQRQIVFVNHIGDSFFMKDEAYLDLLKHQGETRLVKKYNKEKKGYIGGEVLACVTLEDDYYNFVLVYGSQQQIIKKAKNIIDKHEYNILKDTVDEYRHILQREKRENEKFIELLSEADHNVRKRFDIDLKACLKDMEIKKKTNK